MIDQIFKRNVIVSMCPKKIKMISMNNVLKLTFLLLLTSQIGISQNNKMKELLGNGEKAFYENNFVLAKDFFTQAANLDSKNKDCWYKLAASELKLGENDNACEHFYQAFLAYDPAAIEAIKEYCPNFRKGSIMSLNDADEKPKFIYKGKEYLLFINNEINPKYSNILVRKFERSKLIMEKARGTVKTYLQVSNSNSLNVKIVKFSRDLKDAEIIEKEIYAIFNSFEYVSAKNKGVNVYLWNMWAFPIYFKDQTAE